MKRKIPVTESFKNKKGLYFFSDNLFEFWFRFVYPNIEKIERGDSEKVLEDDIKPYLNQFIGNKFEDVCEEILWETKIFDFTKIGKWWHRDREIDVVALNERTKEILFAECKWKSRVNAEKVCRELVEKAEHVQWHNDKRKEYFAVFARSFSKRIGEFEDRKVFCFDLRNLEKILKQS